MVVPELIKSDASVVVLPAVYTYLHRRRQDLITPFLGQRAYKGRFSTGRTRFVLPLLTGFYRWTPRQQILFAQTLDQVTRDPQRDTSALTQAVGQLAALPSVPATRLIELAGADTPHPAVRDVALRALGQVEGGAGVPTLLAALESDQARIAIYALRRVLLAMPTAQALSLLRRVPLTRLTVAKEVVRLLGDLPGAVGYTDLLALAGRDLHRDLRVALLRALWGHLDRGETWAVLEAAAISPDAGRGDDGRAHRGRPPHAAGASAAGGFTCHACSATLMPPCGWGCWNVAPRCR